MSTRVSQFEIEMVRDAKAVREREGIVDERADAVYAEYEAAWAAGRRSADGGIDGTRKRPEAGASGANQYGGYTVHAASDKQIALIKRLLEQKDTQFTPELAQGVLDRVNKRNASDIIDRLLACPDKGGVAPANQASDKQIALIQREDARRDFLSLSFPVRDIVQAVRDGKPVSKRDASRAIDELLVTTFNDRPQATGSAALEAGMYRHPETGAIYKVQKAVHGSGHMYAKLLVADAETQTASFEYASGAIRQIKPEWRMSLEDAKAFGAIYGVCCVCSATLTNEASIEAGIGPVCAGRL